MTWDTCPRWYNVKCTRPVRHSGFHKNRTLGRMWWEDEHGNVIASVWTYRRRRTYNPRSNQWSKPPRRKR